MSDLNNPTTNVSLYGGDNESDLSKAVNVVFDGTVYRLAVDAIVTADVNVQPFSTQADSDLTGTVLNTSTDTSLLIVTARGKLDFIAVNSPTSSNFEVIIKIDGTERFRLPMSGLITLGLTSGVNVPLWADTAGKNFRYHPSEGDDFLTSFELLAKATVATPSVNWAVKWREN